LGGWSWSPEPVRAARGSYGSCFATAEPLQWSSSLLRGHTKSCGCLSNEKAAKRLTTHGGSRSRLYRIWQKMRARCENPKDKTWLLYGARGISVCAEWRDFAPFQKWALANGYSPSLSIDRIDNSLGYSPRNCRWATNTQQIRNRRNTRRVTYLGESMALADACEKSGKPFNLVRGRLAKGWSFDRAISEPKMTRGPAR
jgi:hypothetical protein